MMTKASTDLEILYPNQSELFSRQCRFVWWNYKVRCAFTEAGNVWVYPDLNVGSYTTQLAYSSSSRQQQQLRDSLSIEFRDEGLMWGNPYKNRVVVSFDVRGGKICGYREYLGSDGKSN
jgi:hypothetical protein